LVAESFELADMAAHLVADPAAVEADAEVGVADAGVCEQVPVMTRIEQPTATMAFL
jgi:hypothetical protein